ncbi:hypothetical protein Clacol_004899 [Clathrus columnatus]|uniref:Nephrocystin 3-like N-terminal domain-containing protein n=1 Tax=Clathrus columnatus TaxID=1419009 RepID=A0AAV5AAE7_9AGAM|nr:hypothetical protein Clacol_004899 [Clathrus columnatus]
MGLSAFTLPRERRGPGLTLEDFIRLIEILRMLRDAGIKLTSRTQCKKLVDNRRISVRGILTIAIPVSGDTDEEVMVSMVNAQGTNPITQNDQQRRDLSLCIERIITDTQEIDQNILDLFETLDSTYKFIEESMEIQRIRAGINIIEPIELHVQSYQDSFKKLLAKFQTYSALHTEIPVGRLLQLNKSTGENLDLNNLPYASGAGLHTGKQCLPGTHVGVLAEIVDWINNDDDDCPRLFWLAGSAGTRKSAISHSIASRFESIKRLGSSFCFDKNSVERRDKKFSTIVRDDLDPQIKHELAKIIKDEISLHRTTDLQLQ